MTTPLLKPGSELPGRPDHPVRRGLLVAVGIAVLVLLLLVALGVSLLREPEPATPGASATPTPSATTSVTGPTPSASRSAVVPAFGAVPLWPFGTVAEAGAWQEQYRSTGAQAWHLDAAQTALRFTRDFLGYREIDRVVGTPTVTARAAWVPVGAAAPDGRPSVAAVLHLARIGAGADAPWEVVGSRDTTLTLTTPAYGARVTSPVTVGGRITGVDESLRVQVRTLSGQVGLVGGVPAGGMRSPWSVEVPFAAPSGSVLTVAVSTGGHVRAVERFAITGLRVA